MVVFLEHDNTKYLKFNTVQDDDIVINNNGNITGQGTCNGCEI